MFQSRPIWCAAAELCPVPVPVPSVPSCSGAGGCKDESPRCRSCHLDSVPCWPPTAAPRHNRNTIGVLGPALLQCGGAAAVQIPALMLIVAKSVFSLKCLHPLVSHHGLVINQGVGAGEATGWENGVFDLIGLSLDYLCLHSK